VKSRLRVTLLKVAIVLVAIPLLVIVVYRLVAPPITPLMVIRLAQGEGLTYRWVPIGRISPHLVRAVLAAEDSRFCQHFGFDVDAIADEFEGWMQGDRPRGASTVTQQTAKNILLWPGRDLVRKAVEAWLTPQLELLWSKRRIIEVYLNVIETGPGLYGAEAAAQRYFNKPAADLSPREAALIAAVLPNPRERSPSRPSPRVSRRASLIAARARVMDDYLDCVRP
jgi:monofunctional biosynthetic peptidoglycan transglycosylase